MLILHLSDIHFKKTVAGGAMDIDHHLRNMLVRDVREQCQTIGATPDAVLVTGDIAYGGAPEEYAFAQEWLEQVCAECGCETNAIIVIPGNHDVDRAVTRKSLVQALHSDIKATANSELLPGKLTQMLEEEDSAKFLYSSIANFNDFAAQYFCALIPPDRTKVERRFQLNDGSILCITGLNSAFVSSHADAEGELYVDPSVLRLTHEDGVTHLVMCHHPYNWLANGREVQDHLDVVAQVQLFGHEHTNRVELGRDYVRIAASAAHPDRQESGWEPGYNLLELTVDGQGAHRKLNVKAHVRIWQNRPGQFIAKMDRQANHFAQSIDLEHWAPPVDTSFDEGHPPDPAAQSDPAIAGIEKDTAMTSLRKLSIRFFALTFSQKLGIAGRLNLFEEGDQKFPDHERFRRVLLRARERNQLAELEAALDETDRTALLVTRKED